MMSPAPVVKECMLPNDWRTSPAVQDAVRRITSVLAQRFDSLAAQVANLNTRFDIRTW
ncbi:MAG: hypothetical protein JNL62_13160 [Bryobacterales bacterium]|nr:hypothetical protein [Bryobacterales bacterium]